MALSDPELAELNKKTDAELIEIRDISAGNPYSPAVKIQANIILNERKTKKDNCMIRMTALILILTIVLVVFAMHDFFKNRPSAPMAIPAEQVQSQKFNPSNQQKNPQNKDNNNQDFSNLHNMPPQNTK